MKIFTKHSDLTIDISALAVVRTIIIVLLALLLVRFIGTVGLQLRLIVTAVFLAIALNPAVSWIARHLKSKSRVRATGAAYLIVLALLISFAAVVVPPLVTQTSNFIHDVPRTISDVKEQKSPLGRFVHRYNLDNQVDAVSSRLSSRIGDVPSTLLGIIGRIGGTVAAILTVLVLTFMMLVEGPLWIDRFWQLQPNSNRDRHQAVAQKMYRVFTSYVNGQVFIAMLAGCFSLTAMLIASTITHSSVNAVALAAIVFLFGLIPLIGNTMAAVIVITVCLFSSTALAVIMAVYFIVYQQTENATLQPYIQARNNQLTPLIVFVSALLGAGVGGLLGAFIAIPTAGCLRIAIEEYLGERLPTIKKVEKSSKKSTA